MKNLNEKIEGIEMGDVVHFVNYDEGLQDKNQNVERVSEKAILINGDWFPKSQIVGFDSITKEISFNAWFADKKTKDAWKNRTGGAY